MSEFVVHGVPGSPYLRSALLGLEEKGAPWRLVPLAFGQNKTEPYLSLQPFGRIPAIQHGDFTLYETQAFLRYLDRLFPEPALTPTDPRAEARMNQLLGIADWYVLPNLSAGVVFQRVVAPRFGMPVDEARIAAAMPVARTCLSEIGRLLGDQTYLTGESLSLADLHLIPQLSFLLEAPEAEELLAPHANITAWIARMGERASVKATTWEQVAQKAAA